MLEGSDTVGRFEFRPLEPGYGQTIGNALRRILLSSLEGFAISSIKISGVDQEFATIPGVIEGMQDIILNLKQVRLKRMVDSVDSEVANITVSGKQEFTAEDISKGLSSFKVLNPELHICSLEPSVKLEISLTVTKGRGFVPAEEERDENTPIGTIPVDAIYTPIRKVNWTVENWRVEQKTDYAPSLQWFSRRDGTLVSFDGISCLVALPAELRHADRRAVIREIAGRKYMVFRY